MNAPQVQNYENLLIGSSIAQTPQFFAEVVKAIHTPAQKGGQVLGGRGYVSRSVMEGVGRVVVKQYKRGGILRLINARYYLRLRALRPQIEFELLQRVRSVGVSAPEPVAFAVTPGLLYRGWLITREIENQQTLADISLHQEERAARAMERLVQQVALLVRHRIYHIDLHPGNVLVDGNDNVFLLDFDNARSFSQSRNKLRDLYLCRWRRAVIKHRLPEMLSEMLAGELRKNYDAE